MVFEVKLLRIQIIWHLICFYDTLWIVAVIADLGTGIAKTPHHCVSFGFCQHQRLVVISQIIFLIFKNIEHVRNIFGVSLPQRLSI